MDFSWEWAYAGVNQTIPRNAGPECSNYLTGKRQLIESVIVTSVCVYILFWIWKRLSPCLDSEEEHLRVLQERQFDPNAASGRPKTASGNARGFFASVGVPEMNSSCDKSGLEFRSNADSPSGPCPASSMNNNTINSSNGNNNCDSRDPRVGPCGVQFSLNSGYCGNKSGINNSNINNNGADAGEPCALDTRRGSGGGYLDHHQMICPATTPTTFAHRMDTGKQILLVLMTFVLGLELGLKFASRTVIYFLNPCHITTVMQIYLLAAKPSKFATAIFRIQMNYMNGPLLAFIFPETDSRKIAMEVILYWLQHGLMFINSIYLLRLKHPESEVNMYEMPPVSDLSWNIFSYAWLMVYHFFVLAGLATPSEVNLNHMLCPALSDPFNGPNYRLFAILHQSILCPLMCKTIAFGFAPPGRARLRRRRQGQEEKLLSHDSESSLLVSSSEGSSLSGIPSPVSSSSVASSPSMEHPIQSLNRTEYLNLIGDSEGEDGGEQHNQQSLRDELDNLQVPALTPIKRSGQMVVGSSGGCSVGGVVSMGSAVATSAQQQLDAVFSSASIAMDKTFGGGFLEKKQE